MSTGSRYLSYVLRHAPEEIGLTLDDHGWASVEELIRQLRRHGRRLDREKLIEIVATNDKKRFTLSPDGRRIRAAQGHSIEIDLDLPVREPPEYLYHGTARDKLDSIFTDGLHASRRRKVHLSPDPETAVSVGTRHGKPVVLRIECGRMHRSGFSFWQADNGVWLTDQVPSKYIGFGVFD